MADDVLIQMPDTVREFLIAMAVMQELQVQMVYMASKEPPLREREMTVTYRMLPKFKYLEPCLQVVKNLVPECDYSGWSEMVRAEYASFIDFDFTRAQHACKANKLHITQGFGILLGTVMNAIQFSMVPQKQPILVPLMLPRRAKGEGIKACVVEWDETGPGNKFCTFLKTNYPEINTTYRTVVNEANNVEWMKEINNYDILVSPASAATYVAAALNKVVLEIFPTLEDQWMYNSANLPAYMSTVGNPTAEYMWYMWEEAWLNYQEHLSDMSKLNQSIPTELSPSTVDVAEEKSLDKPTLVSEQ